MFLGKEDTFVEKYSTKVGAQHNPRNITSSQFLLVRKKAWSGAAQPSHMHGS
jgi:hypothetical protein